MIKYHLLSKKECRFPLFIRCACGTTGILCNFYAIDHLLLANANILNKLSPFFAIIFSYFILKEKIKPIQFFCLILAFFGCLCIVKPGFQNVELFPALMGVLGGLGAGIAYTMVRKMGMYDMKGPVIVFYFSTFSTLIVIPWIATHFVMPTPKQFLILIGAWTGRCLWSVLHYCSIQMCSGKGDLHLRLQPDHLHSNPWISVLWRDPGCTQFPGLCSDYRSIPVHIPV